MIYVRQSDSDQPSNDKEEAQAQFSNFLTSQAKPLHSELVKEMLLFSCHSAEICSLVMVL